MSIKELQKFTAVSKYAKHLSHLNRRETWEETAWRWADMMIQKYPFREDEINRITRDFIVTDKVMPAMRGLQFGGPPVFKHNARLYNCLGVETRFITNSGVKSFNDFKDGDNTVVLTHKGRWKSAKVRCYGVGELFKCKFKRAGEVYSTVWATKNHRWINEDGEIKSTEKLRINEEIIGPPNIFGKWNYSGSKPLERLMWCYGYVFGDGTKVKYNGNYRYSMVRLCGEDKNKFLDRFIEMGFEYSQPKSFQNDDCVVYTGKYLKEPVNPEVEDIGSVIAFIRGYLDADGAKNTNKCGENIFRYVQSSDKLHIDFIKNILPVGGVYLGKVKDLTGEETNFGIRPETFKVSLLNNFSESYGFKFKGIDETDIRKDYLWCLEVEDDNSFVLEDGLVTGNCCSSYVDRLSFFGEMFYLLLCGSGVGASIQERHIQHLPNFSKKRLSGAKLPKKQYRVLDSIEGWAICSHVQLTSYHDRPVPGYEEYLDCDVEFVFDDVRTEGSMLSSGVGRAPGPKPLALAISKNKILLNKALAEGHTKLNSINAYDYSMFNADAVRSGGIRRSATIFMFDYFDKLMLEAKTGDWYEKNPQRGRSNNSCYLKRGEVSQEQFYDIFKYTKEFGEPGFFWTDNLDVVPNPCQAGFATILTPEGIRTFDDINVGSTIWSETGWTKVINKVQTGIKKVYKYKTTAGSFIGTENHRIIQQNIKVEVKDAKKIDVLAGFNNIYKSYNVIDVLDGLLIGDGTVHKASNNQILLIIGDDDQEYFDSEISHLIGESYSSEKSFKVISNSITYNELPKTYERIIPERFFKGSHDKVCAFLRGLYSANGSVVGKNSTRVTLKSSSKNLIEQVQIMLSSVGIRSYYTTNKAKEVQFSNDIYECKESYDLNISTDRDIFVNKIGFIQKYKMDKIKFPNREKNTGIKSGDIFEIEYLGEFPVYDITVDNESHTYWTGGLNVSNCCEIGNYPKLIINKDNDRLQNFMKNYDGPIYQESDNRIGLSGFQMCNLTTQSGKQIKTKEDFFKSCEVAARIGTWQAGFTDFPFMGLITEEIVRREALLGVSICGVMHNPEVLLNPEILQEGARIVRKINEGEAKLIGINAAARLTCIKPDGNSSAKLGSFSGAHCGKIRRGFRISQTGKNEAPYQYFKSINPDACEKSAWGKDDECIRFCVEYNGLLEEDMDAVTFLKAVKCLQENWVIPGTVKERCIDKGVCHNVSNTTKVKENEWDSVKQYIFDNQNYFGGVSFIGVNGDRDYVQAPYTPVFNDEEMDSKYSIKLQNFSSFLLTKYDLLGRESLVLWSWCDSLLGLASTPTGEFLEFQERINYEQAKEKINLKNLIYCLKDKFNKYLYQKLRSNYKSVDYSQMVEHENNVAFQYETACAGGKCEV